jgi:hypothetical protein
MKPADGMWEFPTLAELPGGKFDRIGNCRHTITHHRLDVSVYTGNLDEKGFEWKDVQAVPTSSLTRKILRVFVSS